jgi:cobalt-zinc-cadmium efflux system protein
MTHGCDHDHPGHIQGHANTGLLRDRGRDDARHGHHHGTTAYGRAFAAGVALNLGLVAAQAVYGVLANSVALLADAAHNLSDVLGLLLAWGATILARRLPSQRFTYGLRGSSILAALANGAFLLLATGGIASEAIQRFAHPEPVGGMTVIIVAAVGIVVNGVTAVLFLSGRKSDLNIRGAFMHMVADAVVSLGVVLAGVGIVYTGWLWLDPVTSLVICVGIVAGTWSLLRDSVHLALQAVPQGVEVGEVRAYLVSVPGVTEVHDLHIWGMSTTDTALTAHLVMPQGYPGDSFVAGIAERLHHRFNIGHATIQVETDAAHACPLAPDHVV